MTNSLQDIIHIIASQHTPVSILADGYKRLSKGTERTYVHHEIDDLPSVTVADFVANGLRRDQDEVLFDNRGFWSLDLVRLKELLKGKNIPDSSIDRLHPLYI